MTSDGAYLGVAGVELAGPAVPGLERVLTAESVAFLAELERRFREERAALLARRAIRQAAIDAGATSLGLYGQTAAVRLDPDWRIAETPPDLLDRRVEITGPAEPKMMINALSSGARAFMADLEDALSPTWSNVVGGQAALMDAVRGTLAFESPEGKAYRLGVKVAQLFVRPRGWHLAESHLRVDAEPMSASLFDAGLYLFWNAAERIARGSGPYLYLPKLESHLEARLWNDAFVWVQDALGIPRGSIRATVLIETLPAAFEMEEILFELREHSAGLNAGRWDYLFSTIKTFRARRDLVLPDRASITMTVPFMRAYTERLVLTCHRRGAPAMGGMAAFIPSRRDAAVNEVAMRRVREDKERESADGFDGTWVAHPDLVPLATEVFDAVLGAAPNQRAARLAEAPLGREVPGDPGALLDLRVPECRGWAPLPRLVARREGGRRDQEPDGGRGHGRDLAIPALAMAGGRRAPRRRVDVRCRSVSGDSRRGARAPGRPGGRTSGGRDGAARSPRPRRCVRGLPDPLGVSAARPMTLVSGGTSRER